MAPPAPAEAPPSPAPVAKPVEAAPKPAEAKPAEAPKPVEAKPPEKSLLGEDAPKPQPEAQPEPLAPPSYDALQMPEGMQLDNKRIGEFDALLGKYETEHKLDHAAIAQLRQDLANFYVAERQRDFQLGQELVQRQRQEWQQQVRDDKVLGGNRFDTMRRDAARVRDLFSTPRFMQMIEETGAGDHPGMFDFISNVARYLDKRGLLKEGTVVPAQVAPQVPRTSKERRYGGNANYINGTGAA